MVRSLACALEPVPGVGRQKVPRSRLKCARSQRWVVVELDWLESQRSLPQSPLRSGAPAIVVPSRLRSLACVSPSPLLARSPALVCHLEISERAVKPPRRVDESEEPVLALLHNQEVVEPAPVASQGDQNVKHHCLNIL